MRIEAGRQGFQPEGSGGLGRGRGLELAARNSVSAVPLSSTPGNMTVWCFSFLFSDFPNFPGLQSGPKVHGYREKQ